MVFIKDLKEITDGKFLIGYVHYMPFDSIHGLKKSKEELEKEGILIETIPEPQQIEDKKSIMYWNSKDRKIFYEYIDIPKTKEEILLDRVKALEQSNAELMNLIMMQGIAPK